MTGPIPFAATTQPARIRLLGMPGSLRQGSYNRRLLHAAAGLLPAGAQLVVFHALKEIPPYDEDDDLDPAGDGCARILN